MPKLAANLSMMFNEVPFLDRFERAAASGFKAVEYLFPYEHTPDDVAQRLKSNALQQVLFNMPPGNWGAGERGIAALPGREEEFRAGVEQAIRYARALQCPLVHAMAGLADDREATNVETYVNNCRLAADELAKAELRLVLEPINRRDIPGYFLHTTTQARELIDRIARPNVGLQLDLYHAQISEGDLERKIRDLTYWHVQIAGNPARHEPNIGEVDYDYLLAALDDAGYDGFVGCEYRPAGDTAAGLGWAKRYLQA